MPKIKEVDAFRFAKYSASAGKVDSATLSAADNLPVLIQTAAAEMDDKEVPYEGRILFVNPFVYAYIKEDITRFIGNGEGNVNNEIEMFDNMRVIRVPSTRFNTGVTLENPTDATQMGGYTLAGDDINFMIVHPSAVIQVIKHQIPRLFSPEVNQEADAWKLNYRIVHDAWVLDNKHDGIYLHKKA